MIAQRSNKLFQLTAQAIYTNNYKIRCKQNSPASHQGGQVTEIISATARMEDTTFLMPLLAQLSRDNRWLAWVDPPEHLPKSSFTHAGIDLQKIILLRSSDKVSKLELAAKILEAGTYHAIISWQETRSQHDIHILERSAQCGGSRAVLLHTRQAH